MHSRSTWRIDPKAHNIDITLVVAVFLQWWHGLKPWLRWYDETCQHQAA